MTAIATTPRRIATSHAYVVPVVREMTPPRSAPTSDTW